MALKDGVDARVIRIVLAGDKTQLSNEMIDVYEFAQATMISEADSVALREILRTRYGERGLIELAYVIACSRIPPSVKRVPGYAKSCKEVSVQAVTTSTN